jgi:hypothetical protein
MLLPDDRSGLIMNLLSWRCAGAATQKCDEADFTHK